MQVPLSDKRSKQHVLLNLFQQQSLQNLSPKQNAIKTIAVNLNSLPSPTNLPSLIPHINLHPKNLPNHNALSPNDNHIIHIPINLSKFTK